VVRAALFLVVVLAAGAGRGFAEPPPAPSPEQRAVAFLAAEVPRWARENRCYSCHNNGDAARALCFASRHGLLVDRAALDDTLGFLAAPNRWDANGPEGPFKDKKLARIQFAAALVAAAEAKLLDARTSLSSAADLVAGLQAADGSWETDVGGNVGSPVTYGRALATWMAMQTLAAGGRRQDRAAIAKAQQWFEAHEPRNVLDAAATLGALAKTHGRAAQTQRARAWELVQRGQSDDGGWGPFVTAPPEVFDTALVVLALAAQRDRAQVAAMLEKGRGYLLARQEDDGGWPATTRPRGVDSYAQRLSTSGWATQALVATRPAAR
jgi:hypothetical protein